MSAYPTLKEFSLKGKVAVVTGGARYVIAFRDFLYKDIDLFICRGLGLEMSKALAESGADVALMYVSSETTHDTAAAIGKEFGVTCRAYKADIGNAEQVQKAVDQIHKDFGSIDVFVANAGISSRGAAEVKMKF